MCVSEYCGGEVEGSSPWGFSRRCVRVPNIVACVPRKSIHAGSEELVRVDVWYGLPPVTERAVLRHDEGLVLLFAQQREHMLHQLAKPAVAAVEASGSHETGAEGESGRETTESNADIENNYLYTGWCIDALAKHLRISIHVKYCYPADSFHFISIKPLGKYLLLQLLKRSQAPLYCNFVFCSAKLCFYFVCA